MPKAPHKVTVTVIGPHLDEFDQHSRRMAVEVEIQHTERTWGQDSMTQYRIQSWTNRNTYSGGWFEPVMPAVQVPVYGRGIDLPEAEKVVKNLKALYRYIDKLPFRPRNLGELVAIIGAMHNARTVHLATAPDSHTRMGWQETNIDRAARVAQQAYEGLVPEE